MYSGKMIIRTRRVTGWCGEKSGDLSNGDSSHGTRHVVDAKGGAERLP